MLKPLFKHPIGASKQYPPDLDMSSEHAPQVITCEICGSKYLKNENDSNNSDYYFHFLGYRGILQCCGKLIDILYQQWSMEFFQKTLTDFQKDPLSCDNYVTRMLLEDVIKIWKSKSMET